MKRRDELGSKSINLLGFLVSVATLLLATSSQAPAQGWSGYGHDPQHSCLAVGGSQIPQKVRWSIPLDQSNLNNMGGTLYIHYGSPVITRVNTVIAPVQSSKSGGSYGIQAFHGTTGKLVWQLASDYTLPSHDWVPIFGITLTPKDKYLAYPGIGGTIYIRTFPDSSLGTTSQYAFVNGATPINGSDFYSTNKAAFDSHLQICTPISSDRLGNLFFGFVSDGQAPGMTGIIGGLARISNTGVGSFVAANTMAGLSPSQADSSIQKVPYNCAPAFSADGSMVYVAVNNGSGKGYLCALDSKTLATKSFALLLDPQQTNLLATPPKIVPAYVDDDGSATPTVGPDGDVYYGVLAYNVSNNHYRGFLLHFDSTLATSKIPNAFGWDDTASVVPRAAVTSYTGKSSYLLLTKYNNYAGGGGDGVNQVALVDPNASMTDPISGVTVMQTVLTVNGVTPDPEFPKLQGAVREWCINSAAIDVVNKCAVVNSEDGHVYRWDFTSNTLSAGLYLEPSTSEAYTPTVIGPDGAVYAINNAYLFSCIANP